MAKQDLLSITSCVEVPFVIVDIAGVKLGKYLEKRVNVSDAYSHQILNITYPNFISGLNIVKNASGIVNTYTLNLTYAVTSEDDPNLIEKLLSKAKKGRKITFSYGDMNIPNFIFKEEEAIIQNVTSDIDISSSVLSYTVTAVSNSYKATGPKYSFPLRTVRGSELIKELLFSTTYQLNTLYYGMTSLKQVEEAGFIANDDIAVTIQPKSGISVIDYIKYVVDCMRWSGDSTKTGRKNAIYRIAAFDDISSEYGGPYFKVTRYMSDEEVADNDSLDYMTINVGYPDKNPVAAFRLVSNDSFALLYDYNEELNQSQIQHKINDEGIVSTTSVNRLVQSAQMRIETEANQSWWAQMTSYPIKATISLRGLLRNADLLSTIRINLLFYGRKHIYSGVYAITGQTDSITAAGFKTTLSVTRIGGDSN